MELKFEHRTLRTPVDTVNILTAGGIKMGSITEIFGPNAAGKSSIAYQIAKYFQEDYPDGKVYVIDTENSADYIRLKSSFKLDLDVSRFEVEYPPNLEAGFKLLNRACLEDYKLEDGTERPILVIWDTIAVGRPERETAVGISFEEKDLYNMGINSGGMNLRPRIIEHSLAILMPLLIEKRCPSSSESGENVRVQQPRRAFYKILQWRQRNETRDALQVLLEEEEGVDGWFLWREQRRQEA